MSDNHSPKTVKLPQNELLSTLTDADVNQVKQQCGNANEYTPIDKTPFVVTGNKIDGYFLVMGQYRVSDVYNTKAELHKWMKNTWELTLRVISCCIDLYDKMKTQDAKKEN
jgi:hypothetical protein